MIIIDRQYFLGVDIGTTAIKAALFDDEGKKVLHKAQEYSLLKPTAQRVEQIPEVYWDTFKLCVKNLLRDAGIDNSKISAFAMDSSAETIVFMDDKMQPLDNFYVWMDNRAELEAVEINKQFTASEIMSATGQTPIVPIFPAAKILWFKKNKPELFKQIRMMFMSDDYILWHLTGKMMSHGSSWCTSYLWDITQKCWWPEMLDYLQIHPDQLPEIVECGTPVGTIRPEIADELGLPRNLLIVMGGQDQSSGAIGVGNVKPGIVSESTGGALMVCITCEKAIFDPNFGLPCNYSDMEDVYMIQSGGKGGILLRWLRDTLCNEELQKELVGGENAYDLMDEMAASVPAGAEGLFLLPFFGGSGAPRRDIYGRGVLYGLSLGHTRAHIIRAFMEALACSIAKMIEYAENLTGTKVTQVRSLGGGSLSPVLCQIKADVLNRQVVTMKNTQDAACLGAAIIAGYGAGHWPSIQETALRLAHIDRVYEPNPENRAVYDCLLKKYDLLVEATRDYTERLSKTE